MTQESRTDTTSEEKSPNPKARPVDDAEVEGIVGGTSGAQSDSDRWHNLPDGSGSGFGE